MKKSILPTVFGAFGLLLATLGTAVAQDEPVGTYNFTVEIDGVSAGAFKSVDGLSAEIEVIEYQDGDDLILRKRPGRAKFGDVTLKKGYLVNEDLFSWWRDVVESRGNPRKRTISLHLHNPGNNEVIRTWNLLGCWPKAWKVNGFDGKGNDVVTEEITFVVEEMFVSD